MAWFSWVTDAVKGVGNVLSGRSWNGDDAKTIKQQAQASLDDTNKAWNTELNKVNSSWSAELSKANDLLAQTNKALEASRAQASDYQSKASSYANQLSVANKKSNMLLYALVGVCGVGLVYLLMNKNKRRY